MIDVINAILSNSGAFRWVLFLGALWAFYRWMNSDDSEGIEWRDFISAIGADGRYHGDINKVGQTIGVFIASFAVVATAPNAHKDFTGFALVLTACLGFLGAVAAYAATLRSRQNRVETKLVSEPVPSPAPAQRTTLETSSPAPTEDKTK